MPALHIPEILKSIARAAYPALARTSDVSFLGYKRKKF